MMQSQKRNRLIWLINKVMYNERNVMVYFN